MNQPNIYTYSILSRAWNDLDYDVLKLVKEYLRVHLNRRLLHDDYAKFIEKSKLYNPLYYSCNEELSTDTIRNNIRYGFKTTKNILEVIDNYRFGYKYYLFGTDLGLHLVDMFGPSKRVIRKRFIRRHTDNMIDAVNSFSDRTIRDFIRTLMCVEEGLITGKYTEKEAQELVDINTVIRISRLCD